MGQITLQGVAKRFGEVEVIPPLDLTIEDGEFVVFVGPSGCGKSTLLRLIAGLEDVSGGRIVIDGADATDASPAKRGLAMVFQSYALYPHMSVRKNIAFPMKMAGMPKAEQERRIEAAAKALNLTNYLDRRPGQLSGGQRQRVAIGRAIVRERIEQVGTPLDLYHSPCNVFVAGFIGSPRMNLFSGAVAAEYGATTIGIRPEHLLISDQGGKWKGRVGVSEHLGSDSFFYVEHTGLAETVTVRSSGDIALHHGDDVWLTPDEDRIHRFGPTGDRL